MAFANRREYLFLYGVKDANPNGDPLNGNAPRKDEETGQILVSDVRVKRTVRDEWMRQGENVFVDGEPTTLKDRVQALKVKTKKKTGTETLAQCIDTRLFGVTFALDKEAFSWCGPVQFKWGRSLHKVREQFVQGTAAFVSKDGKDQRSFRNEYIVPYCIIGCYGIANQNASQKTGATEADLEKLFQALWSGTGNLISRSKIGHNPLFLLEVTYAGAFNGAIGALDDRVALLGKDGMLLDEDAQYALRSCDAVSLDATPLAKSLSEKKEHVKTIRLLRDGRFEVTGFDEVRKAFGEKFSEEVR